jgi:DNA/RNA endonuclease G (NUC1)
MLRSLQIIVLLVIALIISEVALWLFLSEGVDTFSFFFSLLFGYASLLSLLFFGNKVTWLGKVLKYFWNTFLTKVPGAFTTSLFLLAISILIGYFLFVRWETIKFNTIFEVDSKMVNVSSDSSMQIENIHTSEISTSKIDENGRARFRSEKDSILQVKTYLGDNEFIFQPMTIETIPFYKMLNMDNAEKQREPTSVTQTESKIASFNLPQLYFQQFNTDLNAESQYVQSKQHVKYGLPGRVNIIEKSGYIFSFNQLLRIPNWVAYWFTGEIREISRPRNFVIEPLIDISVQALNEDYRGSGYDRGHLVSIADMKFLGVKEVSEANSMATAIPKSPYLNRKTWYFLEEFARNFAKEGVGIIAGPIFQGKGNSVQLITIGANDVAVPTHVFRIIYRDNPDLTLDVLAFIVPNSDNISNNINDYLISVDAIEKLTGLDFFNELTPEIEERIESVVPTRVWEIN